MQFDFSGDTPLLKISTYSSHYQIASKALEEYASWYRDYEQPDMSDAQFIEADNFTLELSDFNRRFDN